MADILTNTSLADLIVVNVWKGTPTKEDPCPLLVSIDPIDKTKRFVIDASAQKILSQKLTEKMKDSDIRNPNTVQYAKEFVTKMLVELDRNGLAILEDIPDSKDDPYLEARKQFKR